MAATSRPGVLQTLGALVFCGAVLAVTLQYTLCSGPRLRVLEKPTGIACRDSVICRRELHEPSICRKLECVRLATKECKVVADSVALERDDTVWIGAMFPKSNPREDAGAPDAEAAELRASVERGQRELADRGAGQGRPLGIVLCDDDAIPDPAAPTKNALHLVHDVGVPAIIGFRSTEEAMRLASSVVRPELVILARETDPLAVPRVPDNVWRLTFDTESTARALASSVRDELEPLHRKLNDGDDEGAPLRVAIVRPDHEAAATFAKALARHFAPLAGVTVRELTIGDGMVDALAALKPQVVVYAGEAIGFLPVILELDQRRPASSAWPRYIGIGAPDPAVANTLESLAALRVVPQVFAVMPKRLSTAQEAIVLLGEASRALSPDEPVTGPALAKVLARTHGNTQAPLDPTTREAVGLEQVIVKVGPR